MISLVLTCDDRVMDDKDLSSLACEEVEGDEEDDEEDEEAEDEPNADANDDGAAAV